MVGRQLRSVPEQSPGLRASAGRRRPDRTGGFGIVDAFDRSALRCAGLEDLGRLLGEAASDLGFDHYALVHHCFLERRSSRLARLHNYPLAWEAELIATGLALEDPVHMASVRTNSAFAWSELGSLVRLGPRQRIVLERSSRFGIGEGFTAPANVPGEPSGSCSFATRRGRRLPRASLHCAALIGARAFASARRLLDYPCLAGRPHLSRRERECLRLVAIGKSDWEIARILGIGRETARHYVKRARAAYDVVTRTQLVVHGLRDGLISFEEASPP